MAIALHYNTVAPQLKTILRQLMQAEAFAPFRLVGGTALSLYYGHRMSVDIDLFTDADYGSVDFEALDVYLRKAYPYVDTNAYDVVGMGRSYYVGASQQECIKLDLFYTDPFIAPASEIDGLRLASPGEIAAMKLDVVQRTGRKKDFWDIDVLREHFTICDMFRLHEQRYPYTHNRKGLRTKFIDFTGADTDFDPICLMGKHWEVIKLDMIDLINGLE